MLTTAILTSCQSFLELVSILAHLYWRTYSDDVYLGLPYFKFLKKESQDHRDGEVAQADFARMQREVLENYLINLIRAVVGFVSLFCISIANALFADVSPYRKSVGGLP